MNPDQNLQIEPNNENQQPNDQSVDSVPATDTTVSEQSLDQLFPDIETVQPISTKRKLIILALMIILIGLSSALLIFLIKGNNTSSQVRDDRGDVAFIEADESKNIVDLDSGKLSLSPLIKPEESLRSQDLKAEINQQINLADGFSFAITKINEEWTPSDDSIYPSSGKRFVAIDLLVGNRDKNGSINISAESFYVKTDGGATVQTDQDASLSIPNNVLIKGVDIKSGSQNSMTLVFQIPNKSQKQVIIHESKYFPVDQQTSSSEKNPSVQVKGSVSLK